MILLLFPSRQKKFVEWASFAVLSGSYFIGIFEFECWQLKYIIFLVSLNFFIVNVFHVACLTDTSNSIGDM